MDDAGFNPYAAWLGMEPQECPPTHYRLLDIPPFESRLDVIAQAAQNQVSFVETKISGAYEAHARKLLAELILARNCLLNPAARQAYDCSLRASTKGGIRPPWPAPNARPAAAKPQPFNLQPQLPQAAYQPVAVPRQGFLPVAAQPVVPVEVVSQASLPPPRRPISVATEAALLRNTSASAPSSQYSSRKGRRTSNPWFMGLSIVCGGITGVSIALIIANSVNSKRQEQWQQEAAERKAQEQAASAARVKRKVIIRPPSNQRRPQDVENGASPMESDFLGVESGAVSSSRNPE